MRSSAAITSPASEVSCAASAAQHFVELVERDVERTKRLPFEVGQFLVEGRPQVARDLVRQLRFGWSHPNRPVT